MIPNPEAANAAPEVAVAVDSTGASFATLMHRGIERLANLQKSTLDMVVQQTADINATMRKSIKVPAELSGSSFPDFTGQAVEGWIVAQKNVLDLMVDRKSTRLNSSHLVISYAVFCLKKKKK